jgi:hypothetical protein
MAALRAGRKLAAAAATASTMTTAEYVPGSVAASTPAAISAAPSFITSVSTAPGVAPNAMRMPISSLRCATEKASTPYTPTMAIRNATAANLESSTVLKRGLAVYSPMASSSVPILVKIPGWSARN